MKLRLERCVSFHVWQEITVEDDIDLENQERLSQLFSELDYPEDKIPDPNNGKIEYTQYTIWEEGTIRAFWSERH